jgi:hypothetical protein
MCAMTSRKYQTDSTFPERSLVYQIRYIQQTIEPKFDTVLNANTLRADRCEKLPELSVAYWQQQQQRWNYPNRKSPSAAHPDCRT